MIVLSRIRIPSSLPFILQYTDPSSNQALISFSSWLRIDSNFFQANNIRLRFNDLLDAFAQKFRTDSNEVHGRKSSSAARRLIARREIAIFGDPEKPVVTFCSISFSSHSSSYSISMNFRILTNKWSYTLSEITRWNLYNIIKSVWIYSFDIEERKFPRKYSPSSFLCRYIFHFS